MRSILSVWTLFCPEFGSISMFEAGKGVEVDSSVSIILRMSWI